MKPGIVRSLLTMTWLSLLFVSVVNGQSPPSSQSAQARQINLSVSLSCRGGICPSNLEPSDFALMLDKEPQAIRNFSDPSVPMSLMIVLDLTASMKNHELYRKPEILRDALGAFFNELKQPNEYSFAVFGKEMQTLQDWTPNATAVWRALNQLPNQVPGGSMDVYEVLLQAIERLEKRPNEKRVLLLITDTDQLSPSGKVEERFRQKLQASNVMICGIYVRYPFGRFDSTFPGELTVRAEMNKFTHLSGGVAWYPRSKENLVQDLFCIATTLKCLYLIGFNPSTKIQPGRQYPIKVAVKSQATFWHLRETYFAPVSP